MIESWNSLAAQWWQWMTQMTWQAGLLIGLVLTVDRLLLRRAWPQLRMALWAVVLIKLVVPPTLSSPLGIPSPGSLWKAELLQTEALAEGHAVQQTAAGGRAALSLHGWLMALWLGGSASLTGGLLMRYRRMRRRIGADLLCGGPPQWLLKDADWAAARLGLKRAPRLCLLGNLENAAAFGLLRPVILLPTSALDQVPRRDWRHVLLHEMAHIRRGDLWLQLLCQALMVFYWFYPLLYLVRIRVEQLRELCCDSLAASRSPAGVEAYRRTLLIFAGRLLRSPRRSRMPVGLLGGQAHILARLEWLARPSQGFGRRHQLAVALLAALAVVVALPMASPSADQPSAIQADPVAAQAWENLRQAKQGNNPGCLRLRYSALYLTLQQQEAGGLQ